MAFGGGIIASLLAELLEAISRSLSRPFSAALLSTALLLCLILFVGVVVFSNDIPAVYILCAAWHFLFVALNLFVVRPRSEVGASTLIWANFVLLSVLSLVFTFLAESA